MCKLNRFVIFPAVIAVFCVSCFSPWNGANGEGTLTISVGTQARRLYGQGEQEDFTHEVTLKNHSGKIITETFAGESASLRVQAGKWAVTVKAFEEVDNNNSEKKLALRARGTTVTEIKAGQDSSEIIEMFSASEVESWEELAEAVDGDPDGYRVEYIIIKGNIEAENAENANGQTSSSLISISRNIILIAEEDITIIRGEGFGSIFFNVDGNGSSTTLTLGEEGMTGSITIDGNGETMPDAYSSICVIEGNSTLVMYDGVILKNNNSSAVSVEEGATFTMNGGTISENNGNGGVSVFGTFNMHGGSISGNTAKGDVNGGGGNGGGVCVSGGTFIKTGGTIYGIDDPVLMNRIGGNGCYGNAVFASGTVNDQNIEKYKNGTSWPSDKLTFNPVEEYFSGKWDIEQ